MIELKLWTEDRDGDRRISFSASDVLYYSAIQKRRAYSGWNDCTKITLSSGESFVVTSCYDVVQKMVEREGPIPIGALWLRYVGGENDPEARVVVEVEVDGEWVQIMSEPHAFAFSVRITADGIRRVVREKGDASE